jgi:DNA polymerase-3 subunit delta'
MDDFLDLFAMWFRDVLIFKSTWDTNRLIFKSDVSVIRDQAEHTTYNGLNDILEAIDKVKVRLKANVTFELALELLYMTIRENM